MFAAETDADENRCLNMHGVVTETEIVNVRIGSELQFGVPIKVGLFIDLTCVRRCVPKYRRLVCSHGRWNASAWGFKQQ